MQIMSSDRLKKPGPTLWSLQAKWSPYLFVAPFVLLFVCFMLYPLLRSLFLSVHKSAGPDELQFVGGSNFWFLLRDRMFWWAVVNTVAFAILFLSIQIPCSLLLAIILNNPRVKFRNLFRFAFFSTHLVGSVFVAVMFNVLLGGRTGVVNQLLARLRQALIGTPFESLAPPTEPIGFLTNPNWTMPAILVAALYLSVGYGMVYILAALQSVDRELYEAADVDGAGRWQRFWHITLPGIRPVMMFLTLIGLIGAMQLFELPYVLFNGAGPNNRGLTIVMYLFNHGFEQGNLGYASAVGWALVIIVASLSYLHLRLRRVDA
jgi:ABC-type sugar transport system permease subunit